MANFPFAKNCDVLELAKFNGYIIHPNKEKIYKYPFTDQTKKYGPLCVKYNRVYIQVVKKTKYAQVDLDMITTPWELTEQALDQIHDIYKKYRKLVKNKDFIYSGHYWIIFWKVPNELSEKLAKELFQITLMEANLQTKGTSMQRYDD